MHTDVDETGWEEVYRANGVRCDIEEDVSSQGDGVCPTSLANPFLFYSPVRERTEHHCMVPLETFV
jgi:hypothetical protein